jgi:hypothetical protein
MASQESVLLHKSLSFLEEGREKRKKGQKKEKILIGGGGQMLYIEYSECIWIL